MNTNGLAAQAEAQAHAAAPGIARVARIGYAAKGVVYLIIATLAVRLAAGVGGRTTDPKGALEVIRDSRFGQVALIVVGVGLLGYALWAVLSASIDAEQRGSKPKGFALRIGQAARGLAYGSLGVESLRLVRAAAKSSTDSAEHWTARALALPAGRTAIAAVAIGIGVYALYQLYRATMKDPAKRLDLGGVGASSSEWIVRLGRFGIFARGIVFLIIAWFLAQAALRRDAQRAGGIDESLTMLVVQPYGKLLLGVVALGLGAYGLYQLANARYRRMLGR